MDELIKIREEALKKLSEVQNLKELNDLRVLYLGKKGPMQQAMKQMKTMAQQQRAEFGKVSNQVKKDINDYIENTKLRLEELAVKAKLAGEDIDISLPGYKLP